MGILRLLIIGTIGEIIIGSMENEQKKTKSIKASRNSSYESMPFMSNGLCYRLYEKTIKETIEAKERGKQKEET